MQHVTELPEDVFSNEAGMGSAAITAAAATTDHPVRQAYINMTGTFWDTIVVCTITGLAIASSGVLGQIDPATGEMYIGSALTIAAFSTVSWQSWRISGNDRNCTFCIFHNSWMGVSWRKGV